jgi:hypothetical protein
MAEIVKVNVKSLDQDLISRIKVGMAVETVVELEDKLEGYLLRQIRRHELSEKRRQERKDYIKPVLGDGL